MSDFRPRGIRVDRARSYVDLDAAGEHLRGALNLQPGSLTVGLALGFYLAEKPARAVLQAQHDRDIAEVNARLDHTRDLLKDAAEVILAVRSVLETGRLPDTSALQARIAQAEQAGPASVSPLRSILWTDRGSMRAK